MAQTKTWDCKSRWSVKIQHYSVKEIDTITVTQPAFHHIPTQQVNAKGQLSVTQAGCNDIQSPCCWAMKFIRHMYINVTALTANATTAAKVPYRKNKLSSQCPSTVLKLSFVKFKLLNFFCNAMKFNSLKQTLKWVHAWTGSTRTLSKL